MATDFDNIRLPPEFGLPVERNRFFGYIPKAGAFDMPSDLSEPWLIDPNANVYLADTNFPDSLVYVEKYAMLKGTYQPLTRGEGSNYHEKAYLVAETNFDDIGGGVRTFERHYARVPSEVLSRRIVSVPIAVNVSQLESGGVTTTSITIKVNDSNTTSDNKSFVANRRLILRSTTKFYRSVSIERLDFEEGEEDSDFTDPLALFLKSDTILTATSSASGDTATVTLTASKGDLISRSNPEIFIGDINRYEELRLNADLSITASSNGSVTIA